VREGALVPLAQAVHPAAPCTRRGPARTRPPPHLVGVDALLRQPDPLSVEDAGDGASMIVDGTSRVDRPSGPSGWPSPSAVRTTTSASAWPPTERATRISPAPLPADDRRLDRARLRGNLDLFLVKVSPDGQILWAIAGAALSTSSPTSR